MGEHETPDYVTEIPADGSVSIPAAYLRRVGYGPGQRVSVRVTELVISDELRRKGIGEEEVGTIGGVQLEPRENVLTFLASEGMLARNAGTLKRFRAWLRSGR